MKFWDKEKWVKDSTIEAECKSRVTITTVSLTTADHENPTDHNWLLVGGCAAGGLLLAVVCVCALAWKCKKKQQEESVEDNPVYMCDYDDTDNDNEIYDTNAYYAASDLDDKDTSFATDLNPMYESTM